MKFLERCVNDAAAFSEIPPAKRTVTAARMVEIFEDEKRRYRRRMKHNAANSDPAGTPPAI